MKLDSDILAILQNARLCGKSWTEALCGSGEFCENHKEAQKAAERLQHRLDDMKAKLRELDKTQETEIDPVGAKLIDHGIMHNEE